MKSRTPWLLALTGALACAPRASVEQCEQMVEHLIELSRSAHVGRAAEIAGTAAEAHRASLRDRCIDDGTEREVACVLEATSLDAIQHCRP
ncbi:hypothetical protein DB30_04289 [Enhygromyxa salina]|uniref:Uncharacterized protein n=1 Tax=Enhygromyxa salina TaxID=215803 RepID=A0A0C2D4P8_9BACT|nr:hypothetical protein [Enhygromyxa salina]KIG16670.1 hypothetical protein DB30_04289 [Enhygromyxa salina]